MKCVRVKPKGNVKRWEGSWNVEAPKKSLYFEQFSSKVSVFDWLFLPPSGPIPGLKPGLVEKFAAARTNAEKRFPQIGVGITCGLIWSHSSSLKVGVPEAVHHGSLVGERGGGHLLCRVPHSKKLLTFFWGWQLSNHCICYTWHLGDFQFPRQAKEKSKGTWRELPLSELEEKYKSPEARQWLKDNIVSSLVLRFLPICLDTYHLLSKQPNYSRCSEQVGVAHPQARVSATTLIFSSSKLPALLICRTPRMSEWSCTRSLRATSTPVCTSIHMASKKSKPYRMPLRFMRWTLQSFGI